MSGFSSRLNPVVPRAHYWRSGVVLPLKAEPAPRVRRRAPRLRCTPPSDFRSRSPCPRVGRRPKVISTGGLACLPTEEPRRSTPSARSSVIPGWFRRLARLGLAGGVRSWNGAERVRAGGGRPSRRRRSRSAVSPRRRSAGGGTNLPPQRSHTHIDPAPLLIRFGASSLAQDCGEKTRRRDELWPSPPALP